MYILKQLCFQVFESPFNITKYSQKFLSSSGCVHSGQAEQALLIVSLLSNEIDLLRSHVQVMYFQDMKC